MSQVSKRDLSLDSVRGLAIIIMIFANLAPYAASEHPLWYRFVSSLAAPIFIVLAGAMVAYAVGTTGKGACLGYFAKRGAFVMGMGAVIDIIAWRLFPFNSVDVLYHLGLTLPLLFLSARLGRHAALGFSAVIFLLTPWMQATLGYAHEISIPKLEHTDAILALGPMIILKHWIVDGWFPIFPWLGYGFFGVFLGDLRQEMRREHKNFFNGFLIACALAGLLLGLILFQDMPGPLHLREGFSELFYPASSGFVVFSLAAVVLTIALMDALMHRYTLDFLRVFGEASMFMYLAHLLVFGLVLEAFWPELNIIGFSLVYTALILGLYCCGHLLRMMRRKYSGMPLLLKWVIG